MVIHKKCVCCSKIGHKEDMIYKRKYWSIPPRNDSPGIGGSCKLWYHEECYIKEFKVHKEQDINGNITWIENK